jgi:hypothetical protein
MDDHLLPPGRADSPETVAESLLDLIPELTDGLVQIDADNLKLGPAYRSYFIGNDELRHLHDLDLNSRLSQASVMTFPIEQGDRVVSSVTVARTPGGGWAVEGVGSANQVRAVTEIRDHDAAETGHDPQDYFVLSIPGLKVVLVATKRAGGLMVSDAFDDPRLGLRAGAWKRVDEVLGAAAELLHGEPNSSPGAV